MCMTKLSNHIGIAIAVTNYKILERIGLPYLLKKGRVQSMKHSFLWQPQRNSRHKEIVL